MDYKTRSLTIDNTVIGNSQKVFIIAEIGMNHNGSIRNALTLIDHACDAGVDCVKFQLRNLAELYSKEVLDYKNADLGVEYQINLLKKFSLSLKDYKTLSQYAKKKGLTFLCTPWDKASVDVLENLDIPAYKIASADLTNMTLLEYIVKKNKPLLISTGMSTENEINLTVNFLKKKNAKFALLHCNSTYPTPIKHLNLNYIDRLKKFNIPIGYSGHERGFVPTLAAVAKGVSIVERHITLNKDMEGPDHLASLDINEFKNLVENIRIIESALGKNSPRKISQGELINRENLSKSIYAKSNIKKGNLFTLKNLEIKSPGQGLNPQYLESLIGKKARDDVLIGNLILPSHYKKIIKPKKLYKFNRPWAIPVRYHDINSFLSMTSPDLIEFHLSFSDLTKKINNFLKNQYKCGFIIHAPELFENDDLLDLCSNNKSYRKKSIDNLKKVVDITKSINKHFPKTSYPKIIINSGGFSKNNFINIKKRGELYNNLIESLKIFKKEPVKIIPQNMAPFPWHFGGQRYQNLFLDVKEIIRFCSKTNSMICHDISHSFLACNYNNWDHIQYVRKLTPYAAHYHIADADDVDGEGLQLGDGAINFTKIFPILNKYSQNISFIPEIWQGHKNQGEGFWKSLKFLERKI